MHLQIVLALHPRNVISGYTYHHLPKNIIEGHVILDSLINIHSAHNFFCVFTHTLYLTLSIIFFLNVLIHFLAGSGAKKLQQRAKEMLRYANFHC